MEKSRGAKPTALISMHENYVQFLPGSLFGEQCYCILIVLLYKTITASNPIMLFLSALNSDRSSRTIPSTHASAKIFWKRPERKSACKAVLDHQSSHLCGDMNKIPVPGKVDVSSGFGQCHFHKKIKLYLL